MCPTISALRLLVTAFVVAGFAGAGSAQWQQAKLTA